MEQTSNITLLKYADSFYRKKYLLAWLLLLSLAIGLTAYLDKSEVYQAAARGSTPAEDEVLAAKAVMDQKDQAMRDYKRAHADEMPDRRPANVERMAALQKQYRKNQDAILAAQKSKALWQEQAKALRQAPSSTEPVTPSPQGGAPAVQTDSLTRARNQLEELRQKYTENHPEVKRLVAQIKKMEAESLGAAVAAKPLKGGNAATERTARQYEEQIKTYDVQIAAMTKENEDIAKQVQQLQKWVEAAPIRETEWSSLTSDYAVLKQQYDKLVEKNRQAQSAQNEARRPQSGQSRLEDSTRLPETSFKSDFRKIMGTSVLLAIVLSAGLVILSAFFDRSFRIPADLESYLRLPVVSVVSYIPTVREKKRARILFLTKDMLLLFAGILVLGYFAWAWLTGKIVT